MRVEFKRPLFVGPHPDDVELGCGGTIARFTAQAAIGYLILSPCLEDPRNANILTEAEAAADALGIDRGSMIVEDLPRRTFHDNREAIRRILIAARERLDPDLVFCPSLNDVHQDHQVAAEETFRLFRDASVFAYESPRSSRDFVPELYVTIDDAALDTKVEALRAYRSQYDRYYFEDDVIRAFARMRGAQCRSRYAEAYEVLRMTV